VQIVAWVDAGLDTGKFVPYAADVAKGLRAELRCIRADSVAGDVSADMLLHLHWRPFAWNRPFRESASQKVLRTRTIPLCLVGAKTLERGYGFSADPIVCEVDLDGSDGPLADIACAIAHRTGGELVLVSSVPPPGEDLLARGVEGPGGAPLSCAEALRRMYELGRTIALPHRTEVITGSTAGLLQDIVEPGRGLVIARRSRALGMLRAAAGCPVLAVTPASERTVTAYFALADVPETGASVCWSRCPETL
jgi:hypothetical protein